MTDWYTADDEDRLLGAWPDAPTEDTELLGMLLDTARQQVIAYAPAAVDVEDALAALLAAHDLTDHLDAVLEALDLTAAEPSSRLVYAQLQQSINLWNAGRVNGAGDLGVDSYTFTPRPLDKTIRQIIRPVSVAPDVY